jgi:monovalent cation:H+ antiporter, CPA1 family
MFSHNERETERDAALSPRLKPGACAPKVRVTSWMSVPADGVDERQAKPFPRVQPSDGSRGERPMHAASGINVSAFLELLIAVAIVAAVVRFIRIPYTVALVLVGLALALFPDAPRVALTPDIILTVFLPVLLFYGAYHLDIGDLRANLTPVVLLAVPGVVVTAGLTGLALHLAVGLDWAVALLFGTIVAATDPVAVLAVFGEVGAPRRLATIVTAESLFNDGTALVFFSAVLGVAIGTGFDLGITFEHFVLGVAGSLALGAAVAIVGTAILQRIDDALLETTITLIMAYGGYLLAAGLGASGPLETVMAGLLLGVRGRRVMSATTRLEAGATWEFLDFLANSLLFLLMGLAVRDVGSLAPFGGGFGVLGALAVVLVAITAARALVVWLVGWQVQAMRQPLPRGWRTVLTAAGLRGAVAFAAALSLPTSLADHDLLVTLTFGVVLVTVVVQGFTIRPLLGRLGLVGGIGGSGAMDGLGAQEAVDVAFGRVKGVEAARHDLEALSAAHLVDDPLAADLLTRLDRQREEAHAQLDALYAENPSLRADREREALRHVLSVQREAVRDLAATGAISGQALRTLLAEIDRDLDRVAGPGAGLLAAVLGDAEAAEAAEEGGMDHMNDDMVGDRSVAERSASADGPISSGTR